MSYQWKLHIPKGVKLFKCKHLKIQKLGGDPPIRIVPQLASKDEAFPDSRMVSIKFGKDNDMYPKFVRGTGKNAVRHLLLFWSLAEKLELKSNYQLWLKLKKAHQEELNTLISTGAEQGHKEIEDAINECISLMKSVKQEFWQLFERLLDGPLVEGWKKIIKDECNGETHIAKGGIKKLSKRAYIYSHACVYSRLAF